MKFVIRLRPTSITLINTLRAHLYSRSEEMHLEKINCLVPGATSTITRSFEQSQGWIGMHLIFPLLILQFQPQGYSTRNRFLVHELKTNTREVVEDVFYLADDESRMMGIYNAKGELIRQRPMTADELQKSIFRLNKNSRN